MENFIENLRNKLVYIVGVTGAEGSSILRFLLKHNIDNIIASDFLDGNSVEKSFKLWHKGMTVEKRNELFQIFLDDLKKSTFYSGGNYLKDILKADIIFVPQSWRLYKKYNQALWEARERKTPFYSLMRIYLELSLAKVVAVTGTVGKGSVANILVQILRNSGKKVYAAGNDTWMPQIAEKIDEMKDEDILVLEVSHRQLLDGFDRPPYIVVFTNLYPNHLDEVSWLQYKSVKLSLLKSQKRDGFSVINYDCDELRNEARNLKSKIIYFSAKNRNVNIKSIQNIYDYFLSNKSCHYLDNILAASSTATIFSIDPKIIKESIKKLPPLQARLNYMVSINGISFYDDIKSTTPWATLAAVSKLGKRVILICGGRTKGINYHGLADKINNIVKHTIILNSELSRQLIKIIAKEKYEVVDNLDQAIRLALEKSQKGDSILISPAAGFFYSDFIKGKKSVRRLVEEMLPS